jgi:hypothetical protein
MDSKVLLDFADGPGITERKSGMASSSGGASFMKNTKDGSASSLAISLRML